MYTSYICYRATCATIPYCVTPFRITRSYMMLHSFHLTRGIDMVKQGIPQDENNHKITAYTYMPMTANDLRL